MITSKSRKTIGLPTFQCSFLLHDSCSHADTRNLWVKFIQPGFQPVFSITMFVESRTLEIRGNMYSIKGPSTKDTKSSAPNELSWLCQVTQTTCSSEFIRYIVPVFCATRKYSVLLECMRMGHREYEPGCLGNSILSIKLHHDFLSNRQFWIPESSLWSSAVATG